MTKNRLVSKADERHIRPRKERRKSLRLRYLIDEFKAGIQKNRADIDLLFTRIDEIRTTLVEPRPLSTKREAR